MSLKRIKPPANIKFVSYLGDTQGCGTIRVIYPALLLNNYRKEGYGFSTFYTAYFVMLPDYFKSFSFIQFQRSATEPQLNMFKHFRDHIRKQTNTPIVYEVDDLLIGIPEWNFARDYFDGYKNNIIEMIKMSDGLTVTTPSLKKVYSKYNSNISIIPNHLPKFVWGDIYPKHEYQPNKKPRILWAGSQNHFALKKHVENGITGGDFGKKLLDFIIKTVDNYEWILCGGYPDELECVRDKIEYHGWWNTFNYPKGLKDIDPDFCIAPLEPCLFNECKSNIKALENVALGCPAVYQDIEPYKRMTLKSNSDEEMISHIEDLANDIDYRGQIWKKDHKVVAPQLWWEEDNNLLLYINSYLKLFKQRI